MIDLSKANEWQHIDPENGLVMPWYVKPFLDELSTWPLKGLTVFEYGAGASTLWWLSKGCFVTAVDSDEEYLKAIYKSLPLGGNAMIYNAQFIDQYIYSLNFMHDIVVVDGKWRDQCIERALNYCRVLIVDNWMQPSVDWMPSERIQKLLSGYSSTIWRQPNHQDWKTAIFTIRNI